MVPSIYSIFFYFFSCTKRGTFRSIRLSDRREIKKVVTITHYWCWHLSNAKCFGPRNGSSSATLLCGNLTPSSVAESLTSISSSRIPAPFKKAHRALSALNRTTWVYVKCCGNGDRGRARGGGGTLQGMLRKRANIAYKKSAIHSCDSKKFSQRGLLLKSELVLRQVLFWMVSPLLDWQNARSFKFSQ